jgi:hypothetical protein
VMVVVAAWDFHWIRGHYVFSIRLFSSTFKSPPLTEVALTISIFIGNYS